MAGKCRLIAEFRLKPGATEAEFLAAWRAGQEIVQRDGPISGEIYRKEGKEGGYVSVITYESEEARELAFCGLQLELIHVFQRQILLAYTEFAEPTTLVMSEPLEVVIVSELTEA